MSKPPHNKVFTVIFNDLPFASIDDTDLHALFVDSSISDVYLHNMIFDPVTILDDKYNNELDVNNFYVQTRHLNIPQSEYIFLDSFFTPDSNTNFTILSLNIRSVPTNLQYFADSVLTHPCIKCDVIGFSETRLDCDLSSLYQIPGYNLYTKNRNRHGGGVALFVSNIYQSSMSNDFSYLDSSIESVSANVKIIDKTILVICVYRPPSGNINDFLDKLTELLTLTSNANYQGIHIIGDFNLDLLKHANNIHLYEFINIMYSFSLFPLVTKPTRVTNTTATLIDQIWSTQVEMNTHNYIIRNDTTDHFPILSQFRIQNVTNTVPKFIYKRCFTSAACENFSNEVAQ